MQLARRWLLAHEYATRLPLHFDYMGMQPHAGGVWEGRPAAQRDHASALQSRSKVPRLQHCAVVIKPFQHNAFTQSRINFVRYVQVPNVKDVQTRSVAGVAAELARLQAAAAAGRIRPEDLAGGTLTVSNIGAIGGTYASPLVNPPEVAIVALGRWVSACLPLPAGCPLAVGCVKSGSFSATLFALIRPHQAGLSMQAPCAWCLCISSATGMLPVTRGACSVMTGALVQAACGVQGAAGSAAGAGRRVRSGGRAGGKLGRGPPRGRRRHARALQQFLEGVPGGAAPPAAAPALTRASGPTGCPPARAACAASPRACIAADVLHCTHRLFMESGLNCACLQVPELSSVPRLVLALPSAAYASLAGRKASPPCVQQQAFLQKQR